MSDDTPRQPDADLDDALAQTFPASDPVSNTVETGLGMASLDADEVRNDTATSRFELIEDGQTAFLNYEQRADRFVILHTEVPPPLRGRRLGERLVQAAVDAARQQGLRLVVICPFARTYLKRHPPTQIAVHLE
jgi:predicted GNAT family acetyltransferase